MDLTQQQLEPRIDQTDSQASSVRVSTTAGGGPAGPNGHSSLEREVRILSAVSDGVTVVSAQGSILYANPALESMFGYAHGELVGHDIAVLSADDSPTARATTIEILRALRETGTWHGDSCSRRKDGDQLWTNTAISRYTLPAHGPLWIAVVRDISQRKALEDELKRSHEQLELAMRGSNLGMWSVDMMTGDMICDARVFEIFGLVPQLGGMTRSRWVDAVHPEDVDFSAALFCQHLKGETPIFQIEHRIRHSDGHWVWVLASGKVMQRRSDGWATQVIGTCQDVSVQKRLSQETQNLLLRLESLLRATGMQATQASRTSGDTDKVNDLTRREKSVLVMIAEGMTSAQIAERMHLSPGTIATHRRNLMSKLDLHSSAEVTRFAVERGLLLDSQ